MTLSIAWIRKIHSCEELWFISDSRLSGGARTIDYCPKIFTLPRSDCAISFAGDTEFAYPFVYQCAMAIETYKPARTRSMDIKTLKTHIVKVINILASSIKSDFPDLALPEVEFIFGGYSWIEKQFKIWNIQYFEQRGQFGATEVNGNHCMGMGKIAFAGDVAVRAKNTLFHVLKESATQTRGESLTQAQQEGWGYRPFAALRDLLRAPDKPYTIGGAPQIIKVYQHLNAVPMGVYWPNKESGRITILGRPMLDYERTSVWIFDPDTYEGFKPEGRESF